MPFGPWPAAKRDASDDLWRAATESQAKWLARLPELSADIVLGSRPVVRDGRRLNEGFAWGTAAGYWVVHDKYYLPDEEGFWEASWYERGDGTFQSTTTSGPVVGMAICTDLWFTEHAREYARQGTHILACPRATELATLDKWIAGGRAAAVMSGGYCVSSNRSGTGSGVKWGGNGWIIDPDGEVLGVTTKEQPYLTLTIELERADKAKQTYPRYVRE